MHDTVALSVFLNSFIIMLSGMLCAFLGLDACFERRRPLHVFFAYFLFKAVVWSLQDVYTLLQLPSPVGLWPAVIAGMGLATYVVIYYTWRADFCKIGLAGVVVDAVSATVTLLAIFVTNSLVGTLSLTDYRGYFGVNTLILSVFNVVPFAAIVWLARPLAKWFREYEVVHKRLWTTVALFFVAAISCTRLNYDDYVQTAAIITIVVAIVVFAAATAYLVQRAKTERRRQEAIERERALVAQYQQEMQGQLAYLDESLVMLDAIADRAKTVESGATRADLQEHAAHLRSVCNGLRHGTHSDNPALDVVLTSCEDDFKQQGIHVEYRVPPIGKSASQAALVARAIMGWVLAACKDAGRTEGSVLLRIAHRGNQLVFVVDMPSDRRRRFPRRVVEESVAVFEGVVVENDDGERKTVRVLLEESQS